MYRSYNPNAGQEFLGMLIPALLLYLVVVGIVLLAKYGGRSSSGKEDSVRYDRQEKPRPEAPARIFDDYHV